MFTIDSEARITALKDNLEDPLEHLGALGAHVSNHKELEQVIQAHPGEWAVKLWNNLPGVTLIHTPPGERIPKFRNRATATERIWAKLCELYPDAILPEDMPKKKLKPATNQPARKKGTKARAVHFGGKSNWAEELTAELQKRFKPGEDFELADVYKLISAFQRRHKENHHVAARLRTTLAQDLRGRGIVKALSKGKYRMP